MFKTLWSEKKILTQQRKEFLRLRLSKREQEERGCARAGLDI